MERRSHPSRGAWIEMIPPLELPQDKQASRTPRGVRGLKLASELVNAFHAASHPSRGAWIEIISASCLLTGAAVAPLAGCVD